MWRIILKSQASEKNDSQGASVEGKEGDDKNHVTQRPQQRKQQLLTINIDTEIARIVNLEKFKIL